ncbi:MAG: hypothetical protein QM651_03820 [Rhodoblastus sp.]
MRPIIAIACMITATAAVAEAPTPIVLKRVKIGDAYYVDGANGWAKVQGLNAKGDGFLAVRAGPGETFAERDQLRNGRFVFALARRGAWKGVIYSAGQDADFDAAAKTCGLDETAARRMARPTTYDGPCKWGWVNSRWLVDLTD